MDLHFVAKHYVLDKSKRFQQLQLKKREGKRKAIYFVTNKDRRFF